MNTNNNINRVLVLFSGGQDSTICLYWTKHFWPNASITALNISYGQTHSIELDSAKKICKMADVKYERIHTDLLSDIGDSALFLRNNLDVNDTHRNGKLPASFIPGRNILFLTIAAMFAYKLDINKIVTGVCETDFSGYPDCREETIIALEKSLQLGMEYMFQIYTPLMPLTKAESIRMAETFDGCMKALAYSHTCYNGLYPPCGKCPSCLLRAKGFKEAGITDPLIERIKKGK